MTEVVGLGLKILDKIYLLPGQGVYIFATFLNRKLINLLFHFYN